MSGYYDRDGNAISMEEWSRLFADGDYKRVARTEIDGYDVSTVWLGLDYNFGCGAPLFFETMVFTQIEDGAYENNWCDRYSTYEAAITGHEEVVKTIVMGVRA